MHCKSYKSIVHNFICSASQNWSMKRFSRHSDRTYCIYETWLDMRASDLSTALVFAHNKTMQADLSEGISRTNKAKLPSRLRWQACRYHERNVGWHVHTFSNRKRVSQAIRSESSTSEFITKLGNAIVMSLENENSKLKVVHKSPDSYSPQNNTSTSFSFKKKKKINFAIPILAEIWNSINQFDHCSLHFWRMWQRKPNGALSYK